MSRLTLITVIFLCLSKLGIAQSSEATIKGKIADGGDQKIIDAATVSLLKAKDSSLVKITLTDKEGNFLFEHISFGKYYLLATSTGHMQSYSKVIDVNNSSVFSAGIIQLTTNAKTLKEVSVLAKKPFIERKIDRTVINVDAAITNAGTTAMEVLEKSPGVSVDKDGNISLKGKQGVMIMMDGRPSYLSGQELANVLKNMPSSAIDQIEIMTNPSAKYDAAGNSGIINIKTKKNKLKGINGNISSSIIQSIYTKTNNSINLNYRKGKVNLFGNYNYSLWKRSEDFTHYQKFQKYRYKTIGNNI